MKKVSLSGSLRENVGKKDAKRLRADGLVPAVLYGGDKQVHFSLKAVDLNKVIYTPDVYQINLSIGSDSYEVIVQEFQFHPVTDQPLHVDFLQLFEDKPVKLNLPVRLSGTPVGVSNGGRLATNFKTLQIVGLPSAIPEAVELEISHLSIGTSIRVNEINVPGLTFLDPQGANVVAVKTARAALVEVALETEGEEGAEGAEGAEGGDAPAAEGGDAPAEEKAD